MAEDNQSKDGWINLDVPFSTVVGLNEEWALDYDMENNEYYYNIHNPEKTSWTLPEGAILTDPQHQEQHDGIETAVEPNHQPEQIQSEDPGYSVRSQNSKSLAVQIEELEAELQAVNSVLPTTDARHKEREINAQEAKQLEEQQNIEKLKKKRTTLLEAELAAAVQVDQHIEKDAASSSVLNLKKELQHARRKEHQARMDGSWNQQHIQADDIVDADITTIRSISRNIVDNVLPNVTIDPEHQRAKELHQRQMTERWNEEFQQHQDEWKKNNTEMTEEEKKEHQRKKDWHVQRMKSGWNKECTKNDEENRLLFASEEKEVAAALLAATPEAMYQHNKESKKQILLAEHEEKIHTEWEHNMHIIEIQQKDRNKKKEAKDQQQEHALKMQHAWDNQFIQANYTQTQKIQLQKAREKRRNSHAVRMSAGLNVQINHFRKLEIVGSDEMTEHSELILESVLETLENTPSKAIPIDIHTSIDGFKNEESLFDLIENVIDEKKDNNNNNNNNKKKKTKTTTKKDKKKEQNIASNSVENAMLQEQRLWLRERRWGVHNSSVSEACLQVLRSYNSIGMNYLQRAANNHNKRRKENQNMEHEKHEVDYSWGGDGGDSDRPKIEFAGSLRVAQLAQPYYKGFKKDDELPGKRKKLLSYENKNEKKTKKEIEFNEKLERLNCSATLFNRCTTIIKYFTKKLLENTNNTIEDSHDTKDTKDFKDLKGSSNVNDFDFATKFQSLQILTRANQARLSMVTGISNEENERTNEIEMELLACIDEIEQVQQCQQQVDYSTINIELIALLPVLHLDTCAYFSRLHLHTKAITHAKKAICTLQDYMLTNQTSNGNGEDGEDGEDGENEEDNIALFLNHYTFNTLDGPDPTVLLGIAYHNLAVELEYTSKNKEIANEWHTRACELVQNILPNRLHPIRVALETAHEACRRFIELESVNHGNHVNHRNHINHNIHDIEQELQESKPESEENLSYSSFLENEEDWESSFGLNESLDWITSNGAGPVGNVRRMGFSSTGPLLKEKRKHGSKKKKSKTKTFTFSAPVLSGTTTNSSTNASVSFKNGTGKNGNVFQENVDRKNSSLTTITTSTNSTNTINTSNRNTSSTNRSSIKRLKSKKKKRNKKNKGNVSTSNTMVAERKKKHAANKLQSSIRGFQSRHSNPISVRMNANSEMNIRGIHPAWVKDQSVEWGSKLIRVRIDYSLERSSYSDSLWLVTVFVGHGNKRIMFVAHNATASGNQEMEIKLVIYGKRAVSLIGYAYIQAERQLMKEQENDEDVQAASEFVLRSHAASFLSNCLRLVPTRSNNKDATAASASTSKNRGLMLIEKRNATPPVHLVIKTDIHISLMQARYKQKLLLRQTNAATQQAMEAADLEEKGAATTVQSLFRGKKERRTRAKETKAAIAVQAMLRGKVARASISEELHHHRKKRSVAAIKLQARMRQRSVMKEKKEQNVGATKLQARFRGRRERNRSVGVKHGMMSETAHAKDFKSDQYNRLKEETGLRHHEINAAIRISNLMEIE